MSPRKKSSVSDSDASPVEEEIEQVEPIEEELEDQQEAGSLIERARGILGKGINVAQTKLSPEKPARKKWIAPEKRKQQEAGVASLITSFLVMIVAAWKAPDDLKPNDDELGAGSGFLTSIILRHVNISGRLTQDVMDGIGIIAVIASYLSRTSEARHAYALARAEAAKEIPEIRKPDVEHHDEPTFPSPQPAF